MDEPGLAPVSGPGAVRHRFELFVLRLARDHPSHGVRRASHERCGRVVGGGGAAAAAAVLSSISFRPPSAHAGSRARSGARAPPTRDAGLLSVARIRYPELVQARGCHAQTRAYRPGDGTVHHREQTREHRARSAPLVARLRRRSRAVARVSLDRCTDLLDRAGDSGAALPAPVSLVRALGLRAQRGHVLEHAHHLYQRAGSPARLANALPRRAPCLPRSAFSQAPASQLAHPPPHPQGR